MFLVWSPMLYLTLKVALQFECHCCFSAELKIQYCMNVRRIKIQLVSLAMAFLWVMSTTHGFDPERWTKVASAPSPVTSVPSIIYLSSSSSSSSSFYSSSFSCLSFFLLFFLLFIFILLIVYIMCSSSSSSLYYYYSLYI